MTSTSIYPTAQTKNFYKICSKCKTEKHKDDFYTSTSTNDGLHAYCKACNKIACASYKKENKEIIRKKNSEYQRNNRALYNAHDAKRRATKLQATPTWCEVSEINLIYREAKRLTLETGIEHHVDHIIPLKSDIVCGLHCLANLQILTAFDNLSKHNSL